MPTEARPARPLKGCATRDEGARPGAAAAGKVDPGRPAEALNSSACRFEAGRQKLGTGIDGAQAGFGIRRDQTISENGVSRRSGPHAGGPPAVSLASGPASGPCEHKRHFPFRRFLREAGRRCAEPRRDPGERAPTRCRPFGGLHRLGQMCRVLEKG